MMPKLRLTRLIKPEIVSIIISISAFGFLLGIVGVFQPWGLQYFQIGLILLAINSWLFVIASHIAKPEIVPSLIRLSVVGKILGIIGMLQYWDIQYFQYGFYLLGICTILFIVAAHLPVKEETPA
jgi:hypothetical protein